MFFNGGFMGGMFDHDHDGHLDGYERIQDYLAWDNIMSDDGDDDDAEDDDYDGEDGDDDDDDEWFYSLSSHRPVKTANSSEKTPTSRDEKVFEPSFDSIDQEGCMENEPDNSKPIKQLVLLAVLVLCVCLAIGIKTIIRQNYVKQEYAVAQRLMGYNDYNAALSHLNNISSDGYADTEALIELCTAHCNNEDKDE